MIYLILAKAEQFSLFDSVVHVAPHVRKDGTFVAQHERHQKVRQHDLFADHPHEEKKPKPKASPKARRLISYVEGKGGAERMGALLSGQPAEVVGRMVDGFVKETGLSAGQVRAVLGLGGDRKPAESHSTGREGYEHPVTIDAKTLKAILERTRGEPLAEKPAKMQAWRDGTAKTDPIKEPISIVFRDDGRLDVADGRHRIAVAAERGQDVVAYIDKNDADRLGKLLDAEADQEPVKNENPAVAGPAAEVAPADQEPVKKPEPGGRVVSPDEFPTKEADASYSHISHMGRSRAASDRDAFVEAIQGIYDANLPSAKTDAQKAALLDAVEKAKREYLEENKRLMQVRAGTYSGFVAGRAKLNAKQANRGNASLDRALERFSAMRNELGHEVARAVRNARTPDEVAADKAAAGKEKADKAAAQQAKNDAFLSKLVNFKPGDDLMIGGAKVVRISKDREGLPASISFNDGYDPVKLVGPRAAYKTKDDLRAAVARIKAAAEPVTVQVATPSDEHAIPSVPTESPEVAPSIPAEAPSAVDTDPKEGDTKTVAGIDYRLQDGRWHRVAHEEAGQAAEHPIVEHITKKGKTLRGIVRTDLTKEQAQEIDAYTFKKDGGWFIREKHLETANALDSAHAGGALTPEQHQSAKAANAEGGPAAAKESLKLKVLADKAAKLRQAGQKLADDAAADSNRDRNTNTARRARMAASAEADAAYRESIGKTMMKLADALEAGEVPNLVGVTTRAAIEQLDMAMRSAMQRRESGLSYAESQSQKGRPFDDVDLRHVQMPRAQWRDGDKSALISKIAGKRDAVSLRAEILREPDLTQAIYDKAKAMIGEKELLNTVSWYAPEQLKKVARLERAGITDNEKLREAINQFRQVKAGKVEADPVKLAERAIIGQKVGIDFFPTPKPLAERMARLAAVQPGDKVLEPSAGNGNLADAAKAAGGDVDTVEVSDALRNILQAKGHNLAGRDFDTYEPGAQYDAVIMNPPFSNRQDAAHIMRAWDMVKPGGKLVAIAGEGVFFGSDQKAQAFRDWLDDNAADVERLPEGTFTDKSLLATTSANARLVVIHKPGGPQEGDRKTENGVEYVLQDGRWRRAFEPVPEIEAVPEAEPAPVASAAEIAEDREDLADEMIRDPHGEKARELVQKIAEKEAAAKQADEPVPVAPAVDGVEHAIPAKPKAARRPRAKDVPDDLDPTSPNYRYRDTGYVAGSRKEAVTEQFRRAVKAGQLMRQATIDWEEVESNPREAKELITKSNLFGAVDWAALREGGMDPAAGFLIDRVYASIAPEPTSDGPMGRKDYVLGLESIRDRLERCKTPNEVTAVLGEMRDEWEGVMLNASDADDYKAASAEASAIWEKVRAVKDEQDRQQRAWSDQRVALSILEREQESRARRKWKADPELDAKVAAQQIVTGAAHEAYMAWVAEHSELEGKKRDHGNGWTSNDSDLEWEYREARQRADAIMSAAKARNLIENPTTRAWATLGPRFHAVMNYRRFKGGSKAFAEHVAAAKTGAVKDWSWAEKDGAQAAPRASKKAESFHLRVAESFERQGGRPVSVESTQALKDTYGLRDVQSGNWVLNDPTSAAFHVQRSAEAFADLADLLGVEDSKVSMNGRLAMAFGARGKGNAGWKGAASATYEPVHRVINLTKMGGGGALAHEWWHAIDNLAKEAEGGGESGKDDFASESPSILSAGELRDAFNELHRAMTEGTHRAGRAFAYTERDYKLAKANVDHYRPNDVAKRIKGAADAESAVQAVEDYYRPLLARSSDKRMQKQQEQWTTLAVAYHDGNPAGAEAVVRAGRPMSSFALEALKLDEGQMYRNWSSRSEMSARAFQSWIEDRLAEKGRRNDYLSVYADNKYHVDPLLGPQYPYPDGDERKRINAAFDRLVEVLRTRDTLSKSLQIISKK